MKLTILYSPSSNGFYDSRLLDEYNASNSLPNDVVEMTGDEATTYYMVTPPTGKRLGGAEGRPAWVDVPPPAHAELVAIAEQRVKTLLAEATIIIGPLADAQAGGYIDDNDVPRLTEWQRYRYRLTKVDTSTAPDITLPPRPEV